MDRQKHRQMDRQTDGQTVRQTDKQMIDRWSETQDHGDREVARQALTPELRGASLCVID